MLSKIHDRVTGRPVEQRWLRTYAEALRGYHLHPETKFLDGDYTDRGPTRRRHVRVQMIEDIGKEADKWDDEELSADNEFTVSYGVSEPDRAVMLAVIQSVSKRRLAPAAKVSTRSVPSDKAAANEMPAKEFRRLFDIASALVVNDREREVPTKCWFIGFLSKSGSVGSWPRLRCLNMMPQTWRKFWLANGRCLQSFASG
jgi:hypothetical protein